MLTWKSRKTLQYSDRQLLYRRRDIVFIIIRSLFGVFCKLPFSHVGMLKTCSQFCGLRSSLINFPGGVSPAKFWCAWHAIR